MDAVLFPTMDVPKVNAVGVLELPDDFHAPLRPRPLAHRLLALAFALFFALVVLGTSIVSIGAYCLTSDGANTRTLQPATPPDRASAPLPKNPPVLP